MGSQFEVEQSLSSDSELDRKKSNVFFKESAKLVSVSVVMVSNAGTQQNHGHLEKGVMLMPLDSYREEWQLEIRFEVSGTNFSEFECFRFLGVRGCKQFMFIAYTLLVQC